MPPSVTVPLEVFGPTPKTYSVASDCEGRPFALTWSFDGRLTMVGSMKYDGEDVPIQAIDRLTKGFADIRGDTLVRLVCNRDGVELSLIGAQMAGATGARQIRYNVIDGELNEIRRFNISMP